MDLPPASDPSSERAPLLAERQERSASQSRHNGEVVAANPAHHDSDDAPELWTTKEKIWYSVLAVSTITAIAVAVVSARNNKDLEVRPLLTFKLVW